MIIFYKIISKIAWLSVLLILSILLCSCQSEPETPELTQKHEYVRVPYVDYSFSDGPLFVDDLSQCTDTDKQYVLSDGYLYQYQPLPSYSVVNQLAIATDEAGEIFNSCGYRNGVRIRGVLEIGDYENGFVTGYIPLKLNDVIYFVGNCFDPQYANAHILNTAFYDAEKVLISSVSLRDATEFAFDIVKETSDGRIFAIRLKENSNFEKIAFVRFSLVGSGEQQIICINEEPVPSYERHAWVKSEKYLPEDWCQEIDQAVEKINSIESSGKSKLIKFIFASDIHLDPGSATSNTQNIGKICAEVMQSANIPFFITGGDNCTQSSEFMPSDFARNMEDLLEQLSPIPQKNILMTVGNHDGATGYYEPYGEIGYYRYQLNNDQRSEVFFDWQRETNEQKEFDSDGSYFYMDDEFTKTRYIVLNSFWNKWEGDADGLVTDIRHSEMHMPHFGPQQLKWFAETALDLPLNYSAIIITHFAPDAKDYELFKGIVDAFSNKGIYEGEFHGEGEWLNTNIAVNYTECFGEIIAVFQGHRHTDAVYDQFEHVPCVNITTAGAFWAVRDENPSKRVKGTSTEFAVDAVIIDRESRTIHCVRVGAGEDRVIEY